MYRVNVIGDEALAAKFRADLQQLVAQEPFWLDDVAKIIELSIKQNIAMQGLVNGKTDRPGHKHLIDTGRVFGLTKHTVNIGFGKDHPGAHALEFGAVAHEITGNPILSFWWENRSEWFIGPRVWHPGNRAYRYVYNGTLNAVLPVAKFFVSRVSAIFGGL